MSCNKHILRYKMVSSVNISGSTSVSTPTYVVLIVSNGHNFKEKEKTLSRPMGLKIPIGSSRSTLTQLDLFSPLFLRCPVYFYEFI